MITMKRLFLVTVFICLGIISSAQDNRIRVDLKNGMSITGVLEEMDLDSHVTVLVGEISNRIPVANIKSIEYLQGDSDSSPVQAEEVDTSRYPFIDESDIHGNLIAKGNCVYIPVDSPVAHIKAGQLALKQYIQEWDYWTVVDIPEQAHFIVQYYQSTYSRDHAAIIIRPRKYYRLFPNDISFNGWGWTPKNNVGIVPAIVLTKDDFELEKTNRMAALVLSQILYSIIFPDSNRFVHNESSLGPFDAQSFLKKAQKAFDADRSNNNYYNAFSGPIWF